MHAHTHTQSTYPNTLPCRHIICSCPRVGNTAFRSAFDAAVPDCWTVLNGLDPVPWVPKVCGQAAPLPLTAVGG